MGCSNSTILIKNEKATNSSNSTNITTPKVPTSDAFLIESKKLIGENKEAVAKTYKIKEKIVSNYYWKVYKALHTPTNSYRSLKVIKKQYIKYQDGSKEFLNEISILSDLSHPHILKIYEYFQDQSNFYIAGELAVGGDLFDQISKFQHYSEKKAATIMQQLLSCVSYLHSKSIVHRDIKPDNIILDTMPNGDFSIKLVNFMTANFFISEPTSEVMKQKVGTPYYIAPEVLEKKYTEKCDIWSCGVILFILLCGHPPFEGEESWEVVESVKKGIFNFDRDEWTSVTIDAKNLIKKMLVKDPNKRLSAKECLKDPWIVKHSKTIKEIDLKSIPLMKENIQKFASKKKLQQTLIAFMVHQMNTNDIAKEVRELFKQMNTSGDGRLSYEELKQGYFKFFKDSFSEEEFEELIKNLDQDGSGYIEYEEFLRATISMETLLSEKNLQIAFDFYDTDKSGKLSREEIKAILGNYGSEEIVKKIMETVDLNGDGEINYEEFKEMIKKTIV
jgi:calcium-dependent protein kinase